jgi:hypothetical protein
MTFLEFLAAQAWWQWVLEAPVAIALLVTAAALVLAVREAFAKDVPASMCADKHDVEVGGPMGAIYVRCLKCDARWNENDGWSRVTYYRMNGRGKTATPRTPCGNCGRPFRDHKYITTDRDGALHECPKPESSASKKKESAS